MPCPDAWRIHQLLDCGAGCVVWFAPFQRIRTRSPSRKVGASAYVRQPLDEYATHRPGMAQSGIGDRYMSTFLATSNEGDLLIHEVSDEALEAASGNEVTARYTLANCTGLSECPG
jgi:hypothetical protein